MTANRLPPIDLHAEDKRTARRLAAAEQMAQALDALIGLAVLCQQCPDSWRQNVNAARSARAAWEATK